MINNLPRFPEFQFSLSKNTVPVLKPPPQKPVLLIVASREN